MVVDRQHLTNCDEGAQILTSVTKKVRSSPPLNIYRPPALRKRNEALEVSSCDSNAEIVPVQKAERLRPAKQRRPDIQVYVPRAKRILATPEHNAKSPAALRSTSTENKKTSSTKKSGDGKDSREALSKTKPLGSKSSCHQQLRPTGDERHDLSITSNNNNNENVGIFHKTKIDVPSDDADRNDLARSCDGRDQVICGENDVEVILDQSPKEERAVRVAEIVSRCPLPITDTDSLAEDCCQCDEVQRESERVIGGCRTDFASGVCAENISEPVLESAETVTEFSEEVEGSCKSCNRTLRLCHCNSSNCVGTLNGNSEVSICPLNLDTPENVDSVKESLVSIGERRVEEEEMKDCSLGQEKRDKCAREDIWQKPSLETSSNTSDENTAFQKVSQEQIEEDRNSSVEKDSVEDVEKNAPVTEDSVLPDVLVISDTIDSLTEPSMSLDSKGSGSNNSVGNVPGSIEQEKNVEPVTPSSESSVSTDPTPLRLNPDDCTWDMMFDDNGDCLDPKLIEEITNAVGSVKIEKPKSDYNGYQNKPEIFLDPGDEFAHVVEIYNFPAAFKTEDLVTIFSPYKNGGFEIKWVDNTHALGIFSSSFVAAEVLAAEHPFVKTRPLREASHESRMKARRSAEFLQPYKVRPETCAALARRLVTGALGVKVNITREEREAERRLLREAREKKRLAAKQRDEIWEGTFSAN